MTYTISLYANDGRPVAPVDVQTVDGTLDDAKAAAMNLIPDSQRHMFGEWFERFGVWYLERPHIGYGYAIRETE